MKLGLDIQTVLALMPTGPPTQALGFAMVCLGFAMLCSSTWLPPDSGPCFWNFLASTQCTNWPHGGDLLAIYHILYTLVLGPALWSAPKLSERAGSSLIFTPSTELPQQSSRLNGLKSATFSW